MEDLTKFGKSQEHKISERSTQKCHFFRAHMTEENPADAPQPETAAEHSDSRSASDEAVTALSEYCPFIADVPISSYAEPFPIPHPDPRSDAEIEPLKKKLRAVVKQKKFNPPLPLADFCLVAKERWDEDESDSEGSMGPCLLI